ncbi:hypothetical protein OGM63_26785 [Plectonema radiosum NIES-515]|uniref:Uncharacterized protein n=1 Tax=Plectonema radiosum NIES-515 TaxID=2986073 RepID=A0ABT3B6R5_9CYAN|nr:hypothetical protein [Plectonema radiosum]MCV3217071.1 hypothetical protein [Plectonema radiosum NIES-515]
MNSDLMPSSEPSKSASNQDPTRIEAANQVETEKPAHVSKPENSSVDPSETVSDALGNRQQPIPPPSEPMQYRAIGLVRGRYVASDEQFTQGMLLTRDGVELNAVLLGRIMSLVKNHLDLEKEHLWVVYPRTRQENDALHLQIVGVWEPENLAKHYSEDENQDSKSEELVSSHEPSSESAETTSDLTPSSEITDGGFSVRGEVVYQSFDAKSLVVKIKQAPRKTDDKPKYFKLKLTGVLGTKAVGKFWDFQAKREADLLMIENATAIADLPKKRRPPEKGGFRGGGGGFRGGGGGGGGAGGRKPYPPRRSSGETPRPIKKGESSPVPNPVPKAPAPKPIIRPKPQE